MSERRWIDGKEFEVFRAGRGDYRILKRGEQFVPMKQDDTEGAWVEIAACSEHDNAIAMLRALRAQP